MHSTITASRLSGPCPVGRRSVRCSASAVPQNSRVNRRSAAALVGLLPALLGGAAVAKDAEETRRKAEERKAALRAAAEGMKESGKVGDIFPDSKYAVSDDKSPNVHTRQEEGVRKSGS